MFGDNLLVGVHQYKIDSKGRMFLPASTGREYGEKVYLVYDNELETYAIYPDKVLREMMKKYDDQIPKSSSTAELKFNKEKLEEFSRNVLGSFAVDTQGRICFGNKLDYEGQIDIVGAYNRLILRFPKKTNTKC